MVSRIFLPSTGGVNAFDIVLLRRMMLSMKKICFSGIDNEFPLQ
jgi:hypothetical protein